MLAVVLLALVMTTFPADPMVLIFILFPGCADQGLLDRASQDQIRAASSLSFAIIDLDLGTIAGTDQRLELPAQAQRVCGYEFAAPHIRVNIVVLVAQRMQQFSLQGIGHRGGSYYLVVEDVSVRAVLAPFFHRHGVYLKKERFFALSDPFQVVRIDLRPAQMEAEEQGRQEHEARRQLLGWAHYWV